MERILVVDDEIEICNVLKEFFISKGYEISTALNGQTAITRVKKLRPHIVLLDIMMPGIGGIEVLKEIKKVDPAVGVIMVTAISDEELGMRTLQLGASDYIIKPLDLNYLETVVMVKIIDLLG
ncbi:MAG: response regulator [Deltaproteobacteria bacterium]|nr:response regulator [Deltaproteobacteria bacterium]MBW2341286.1 response regulator [Deltaproteobacteria bacterium]